MGEGSVSDKARKFLSRKDSRDIRQLPFFKRQWESFERNLHYILRAQKEKRITANQARELFSLHYEPLRYHPGAIDSYINDDQEKEFMVAIDSIAADHAENDPAQATRKYVARMNEEAEYAKSEKKRALTAGLVTLGAFTVGAGGYELVDRGIISGHVMNAVVYGIPGTILLAHGVENLTAKHVRAGGLAAVIGLLGFMSGNLPPEQKDLMYPHRAMEISEQATGNFVSHEDLRDYK